MSSYSCAATKCMTEPGKIKVLQIVEDLKVGGLERVIQSLALGLPKERYAVQVWCLTKGGAVADELMAAGVHVEILGMGPRCTMPFLLKLRKKIKDSRIDLLHAHGYTAATIGRAAGFLAGVPVMLAHMHSTYWGYTKKQLLIEKAISLVTDKIICCSRAVADFVVGREKISPRKVTVVYNGVVDMRQPADGKMRAELGLSPDDFVVGVVASLVAHKGHSCFLEAMTEVVKDNPKVKAVLAGDGPLRSELEESVKKLGITANVVFCGIVRDIGSFLAAVDLAVLPSIDREGFSISILEAMSAGRAVIGTKVGGNSEAVSEGKTGLLVPPRDPAALARAVLSLTGDRKKLEKMGRAAREAYQEKFTQSGMITGVAKIYEELCR